MEKGRHRNPMKPYRRQPDHKGFTLIITMAMMIFLVLIAMGLLSLSATSVRAGALSKATAEARANARMALLIALGELQQEMGPDMRISAKASLQDANVNTPQIEGVAQSHWLATYDSWGTWLNANYTRPGGRGSLRIQDTYGNNRSNMFRRWLVSMPPSLTNNLQAAKKPGNLDNNNSVIMVGRGSLGAAADQDASLITRAYLMPIATTGRHAWWISLENHKAVINKASVARKLAPDAWQASQGNTAEVGVGAIQGVGNIDNEPTMGDKLVSLNSLQSAGVAADVAKGKFFDLTSHGQGLITNVRTGQLKKDLSLVFEADNAVSLPEPFRFSPGRDEIGRASCRERV
jgi:type II secretory pathway pseudopilin PulG